MSWFSALRTKMLMLMTALTLLGGCKEVLYSQLTEADANEMMALLVLSGIPASREKDAATGYSLLVDETDLAVAVTVLKNSGLPREQFASMGEVFGDVGVVGTPFEERVRFAYATNQELSQTISQIKGIDNARVHVVIPPQERFGASTQPPRASIVIFHDRSFDPAQYTARIKSLVAFAVADLEIENISSTFFLSPGFVVEQAPPEPAIGTAMASASGEVASGGSFFSESVVITIAMFLIVLLFVRSGMLWTRRVFGKFSKQREWPRA